MFYLMSTKVHLCFWSVCCYFKQNRLENVSWYKQVREFCPFSMKTSQSIRLTGGEPDHPFKITIVSATVWLQISESPSQVSDTNLSNKTWQTRSRRVGDHLSSRSEPWWTPHCKANSLCSLMYSMNTRSCVWTYEKNKLWLWENN